MSTSIPPVSSASANANPLSTAVSSATKLLSQQDFLNLLVKQMTSQDPLNPMQNQDLLSQMVQFSTLQSNTTMQSDMNSMQNNQVFSQAADLLGRQVGLQVDAKTTAQGVVTGVDVSTGTPRIVVNNQSYDLGQIISVSPATTTTTTTLPTSGTSTLATPPPNRNTATP